MRVVGLQRPKNIFKAMAQTLQARCRVHVCVCLCVCVSVCVCLHLLPSNDTSSARH